MKEKHYPYLKDASFVPIGTRSVPIETRLKYAHMKADKTNQLTILVTKDNYYIIEPFNKRDIAISTKCACKMTMEEIQELVEGDE